MFLTYCSVHLLFTSLFSAFLRIEFHSPFAAWINCTVNKGFDEFEKQTKASFSCRPFFGATRRAVTVSAVWKRIQDSLSFCSQPIRAIEGFVQSVMAENGSNCEAHIFRMLAGVLSEKKPKPWGLCVLTGRFILTCKDSRVECWLMNWLDSLILQKQICHFSLLHWSTVTMTMRKQICG